MINHSFIIPKTENRCNSFSLRPAHEAPPGWQNNSSSKKGGYSVVENQEAENMPIGLMMKLAMHKDAMKNFSLLDDKTQKSVINYVESSATGDGAKERIETAIKNLERGNTGFLN